MQARFSARNPREPPDPAGACGPSVSVSSSPVGAPAHPQQQSLAAWLLGWGTLTWPQQRSRCSLGSSAARLAHTHTHTHTEWRAALPPVGPTGPLGHPKPLARTKDLTSGPTDRPDRVHVRSRLYGYHYSRAPLRVQSAAAVPSVLTALTAPPAAERHKASRTSAHQNKRRLPASPPTASPFGPPNPASP